MPILKNYIMSLLSIAATATLGFISDIVLNLAKSDTFIVVSTGALVTLALALIELRLNNDQRELRASITEEMGEKLDLFRMIDQIDDMQLRAEVFLLARRLSIGEVPSHISAIRTPVLYDRARETAYASNVSLTRPMLYRWDSLARFRRIVEVSARRSKEGVTFTRTFFLSRATIIAPDGSTRSHSADTPASSWSIWINSRSAADRREEAMAGISPDAGAASEALTENGFAVIAGATVVNAVTNEALSWLRPRWSELEPDAYLPGRATYRRRRYGRLSAEPQADGSTRITALPETPFVQSSETIPLYKGKARRFAPIDPATLTAGPLLALLRLDLGVVTAVEPGTYEVGVHMVLVAVTPERVELPAPEGRHQDGHSFVAMHLIKRESCTGGTSLIFRPGELDPVAEMTLSDELDTLIINDRRVEHDVTPVGALTSQGTRDMLVVDFDPADDHRPSTKGIPL
jgi:hypothetical protein